MNTTNAPAPRMSLEEAEQRLQYIYDGLSQDLVKQANDSGNCVGLEQGDHGMDEKDLREIGRRCKALGASVQLFYENHRHIVVIGPPMPVKQSSGSSSSSV